MRAEEIMEKEPVIGEVPSSRKDILRILAKNNLPAVPVVKAGTKILEGIVTRDNIFENAEEDQVALLVEDCQERISPEDDIKKVSSVIGKYRCRLIPVVKGKELVGVIKPRSLLTLVSKLNDPLKDFISLRVVPIFEETPVKTAMEIFKLTKEDGLPVLDKEGNLCGFLTEGDLFKVARLDENLARSELGMGEDEDQWTWEGMRDVVRFYYSTSKIDFPNIPISELMVKEVLTAGMHTPVGEVAKKMLRYNVAQLPVLNESGRLAGIVDELDLAEALTKESDERHL
jgi:CBS domain-containing protein